jgi:hypothetical protein
MGNRLKLPLQRCQGLSLEISHANTCFEPNFCQCWIIGIRLYWQTAYIDGWVFQSSRRAELLFQKIPDMQPPHFISGVPIETDVANDKLSEFAEYVGVDPSDIAESIFKLLGSTTYILSPLKLVNNGIHLDAATGYRYNGNKYPLKTPSSLLQASSN